MTDRKRAPFLVKSALLNYLIISWNSASLITFTPKALALSSLLPASSPANTKLVFLETEDEYFFTYEEVENIDLVFSNFIDLKERTNKFRVELYNIKTRETIDK